MPFDPQFDDFVKADTAKVFANENDAAGKAPRCFVLWGDGVRVLAQGTARTQVKVRGQTGWIDNAALGGASLLEFYFIDVGQGDGVLVKTPDFRHVLIDGGYPRKAQPTGKSAADFVDWKFAKDYGHNAIVLDAMVASHIDYDHYGGLDDLLDVAQTAELDCQSISLDVMYHSGLAHWAASPGSPKGFGPFVAAGGAKWFTRLLTDRASAVAATGGAGPQLRGEWGGFIGNVLAAKAANGGPTAIVKLSQNTGWLPGFGQGSGLPVRVLGPIEGPPVGGVPTVMRLASDPGQNSNGTSVLLRFDYGRTRTLLTGDLNANAHRALLAHYAGRETEFAVDIAKCCHHGSEDVSFAFLSHVEAGCTVISSGDGEGHDHPRAVVVAASGLSGHATFDGDRLRTPLVYATETARSVAVGRLTGVDTTRAGGTAHSGAALADVDLSYSYMPPGGIGAIKGKRPGSRARVMHKLVYGLVNVRTDGNRILAATMNEGDGSFSAKDFTSRFPA